MPLQVPRAVRGPMLIVVGAEDQYCPATTLESFRAMLPAATITLIAGADHFFVGALEALEAALGGWAAAVRG